MSKTRETVTAVAVVPEDELKNRPTFLATQDGQHMGVEDVGQFVRPPRLKTVQAMSKAPFKEGDRIPGDLILVPLMITIAPIERSGPDQNKKGAAFRFVPVFFYPEWVSWNPLETKGQQPAIRERSVDPKSLIAMKARDPNSRVEPYPENKEYKIRHVEHLNFVVMMMDGPAAGELAVLSFSKTGHKHGSTLCSLIKQRKADIFGCVFEGQVRLESNLKGEFFNVVVSNPREGSPWVTEDLYVKLKEEHLALKKAHDAGKLVTELDDSDIEEEEVPSDTEM